MGVGEYAGSLMTTFEPLINLIVLLTALSVAAERVTNVLKLRHPELRNEKAAAAAELRRDHRGRGARARY